MILDDLGSIIPLRELDLRISTGDDFIAETLINSLYAAIFTESNNNEDNGIIVIANAITLDEISREKTKTIDRAKSRSKVLQRGVHFNRPVVKLAQELMPTIKQ